MQAGKCRPPPMIRVVKTVSAALPHRLSIHLIQSNFRPRLIYLFIWYEHLPFIIAPSSVRPHSNPKVAVSSPICLCSYLLPSPFRLPSILPKTEQGTAFPCGAFWVINLIPVYMWRLMGGGWPNSHPGKYIQKTAKSGPERRWIERHLKECLCYKSDSSVCTNRAVCLCVLFTLQKGIKVISHYVSCFSWLSCTLQRQTTTEIWISPGILIRPDA